MYTNSGIYIFIAKPEKVRYSSLLNERPFIPLSSCTLSQQVTPPGTQRKGGDYFIYFNARETVYEHSGFWTQRQW